MAEGIRSIKAPRSGLVGKGCTPWATTGNPTACGPCAGRGTPARRPPHGGMTFACHARTEGPEQASELPHCTLAFRLWLLLALPHWRSARLGVTCKHADVVATRPPGRTRFFISNPRGELTLAQASTRDPSHRPHRQSTHATRSAANSSATAWLVHSGWAHPAGDASGLSQATPRDERR